MIRFICILLLLTNVSHAQTNNKFLSSFLQETEFNAENTIRKYNHFDFSHLWTQTENYKVVGIIGDDHQRIKIKLISIDKNSSVLNEYFVVGKSFVKGTICDFSGTIKLTEIHEAKELNFGIDDEYKNKGIKSQGILMADYEFKENPNQEHSGIFKGKLYTKWYLNSESHIAYDDIWSISDSYMNNAFVGFWKSYSDGSEKTCNWADNRVPEANYDFDIGAGEFSPSKKYYKKGWENYQKAWLHGEVEAKKEELMEWWK